MADSPWDMWSALGTLAAVVVALGVSGQAGWANWRAEKDRSELAAAKMFTPLLPSKGKRNTFSCGSNLVGQNQAYLMLMCSRHWMSWNRYTKPSQSKICTHYLNFRGMLPKDRQEP